MKNLKVQIESLLFVTTKPLKITKIKDLIEGSKLPDVKKAIEELKEKFNTDESGIRIIDNSGVIQFTTAPEQAELVKTFIKDETTGELSRPSLETLTIIAYRQPITKAELEQIRGVNCSMILRNLMIRGLVMKKDDKKMLISYYFVTVDFLKFLGINDVNELPDYEVLNNNKDLHKLFNPDEEDDEGMDNFVSDDEVNNKEGVSKEEDEEEDKSDIEENSEPERLTVNVYS
ncbi:SMC-Scp complex subunit ScpB [Patescibacteria group bacterium]|nr:SMC-Scp complex subunit ScpB [Patescibacteria group bacterium]